MYEDTLERKYRVEIERLDEEYRHLERIWSSVPSFALVAMLAPVVGYFFGWGAAVVELLVSAALLGTRAYLIAVRKTENRWNRDKLVEDLASQRREPPSATGGSRLLRFATP
jgi:hypothetical protein